MMFTTWKKITLIFGLIFIACNTSMGAEKVTAKAQNHPPGKWEYKIIAPNLMGNYPAWLSTEINRLSREEGWETFSTSSGVGGGNGDIVIFLRRPLQE